MEYGQGGFTHVQAKVGFFLLLLLFVCCMYMHAGMSKLLCVCARTCVCAYVHTLLFALMQARVCVCV